MYFNLEKNKDIKLWERILAGEFPLIEVIDLPVGRYQHVDLKTNKVGDKCFETKMLDFNIKLEELVMGNEKTPTPTKIYIYPPAKESPYWFTTQITYNPHNFKPIEKFVPYLKVAKLELTSSQYDFEIYKFKLKANREHESEMLVINNTTYRNRRLLLTI